MFLQEDGRPNMVGFGLKFVMVNPCNMHFNHNGLDHVMVLSTTFIWAFHFGEIWDFFSLVW